MSAKTPERFDLKIKFNLNKGRIQEINMNVPGLEEEIQLFNRDLPLDDNAFIGWDTKDFTYQLSQLQIFQDELRAQQIKEQNFEKEVTGLSDLLTTSNNNEEMKELLLGLKGREDESKTFRELFKHTARNIEAESRSNPFNAQDADSIKEVNILSTDIQRDKNGSVYLLVEGKDDNLYLVSGHIKFNAADEFNKLDIINLRSKENYNLGYESDDKKKLFDFLANKAPELKNMYPEN